MTEPGEGREIVQDDTWPGGTTLAGYLAWIAAAMEDEVARGPVYQISDTDVRAVRLAADLLGALEGEQEVPWPLDPEQSRELVGPEINQAISELVDWAYGGDTLKVAYACHQLRCVILRHPPEHGTEGGEHVAHLSDDEWILSYVIDRWAVSECRALDSGKRSKVCIATGETRREALMAALHRTNRQEDDGE